jgi:hypothetical protein
LEQPPEFCLDRGDLGLVPFAVVVLVLVGAPGLKHSCAELKALLAERPLFG